MIHVIGGVKEFIGTSNILVSGGILTSLNRAFVIVTYTTVALIGAPTPTPVGHEHWMCRAKLTSITNLRLQTKATSGDKCRAAYFIVYCDAEEFWCEANAVNLVGVATATATLSRAFDPERTMVIGSGFSNLADGVANTHSLFATYEQDPANDNKVLVSHTNVGLMRLFTEVYTIEWHRNTAVCVFTGEVDLSGDIAAGKTVAHGAASATKASAFLACSFRHTVSGLEQIGIAAVITNDTNLTFQRQIDTGSYQSYGRWYVVQFPQINSHQHLQQTANVTALTKSRTISAVNLAHSIVFGPYASCAGTGDDYPSGQWRISFSSTTVLKLERGRAEEDSDIGSNLVDFSVWNQWRPATAGMLACAGF